MLSEEQANDVMGDLEYLEDQGSHWDALINHLYEMHKIRDKQLYDWLCDFASCTPGYINTWRKLLEMHDYGY